MDDLKILRADGTPYPDARVKMQKDLSCYINQELGITKENLKSVLKAIEKNATDLDATEQAKLMDSLLNVYIDSDVIIEFMREVKLYYGQEELLKASMYLKKSDANEIFKLAYEKFGFHLTNNYESRIDRQISSIDDYFHTPNLKYKDNDVGRNSLTYLIDNAKNEEAFLFVISRIKENNFDKSWIQYALEKIEFPITDHFYNQLLMLGLEKSHKKVMDELYSKLPKNQDAITPKDYLKMLRSKQITKEEFVEKLTIKERIAFLLEEADVKDQIYLLKNHLVNYDSLFLLPRAEGLNMRYYFELLKNRKITKEDFAALFNDKTKLELFNILDVPDKLYLIEQKVMDKNSFGNRESKSEFFDKAEIEVQISFIHRQFSFVWCC
ncbi:MAG: hypothetical protein LBM38_02710 [Clostridiales bacterium]|jgi:hypothetical protein|nr:hypothetical protein [Clostridiales bacterium]